jgi:magnesium transporter
MGRRNGVGSWKQPPLLSLSSSFSKRYRSIRRIPSLPKPSLAPPAPPFIGTRKKKAHARLWMRLDRNGSCEMFMCDKAFVAERSGVHTRDLRVVGPLLSRSPSILGKLMLSIFVLGLPRNLIICRAMHY